MDIGIVVSLLTFFAALAIGIPIGWVFLSSTFVGLLVIGDPLRFTATTFHSGLNMEILIAIGLFVLAGNLLSVSGLSSRIVGFSYKLVKGFKGGLIVVAIVASVLMGALTGSSLPCLSAIAPLMVPELEKFGYMRKYSTAVICCSSFLGYLIPPSLPALIYCLIAQQSVAALFLSTVVPGLILAGGYIILNSFIVEKYQFNVGGGNKMSELEREYAGISLHRALFKSLPALGCPFIVLFGMYGGLFTATEAGAVAVIYTVFTGAFIYKELSRETLWYTIGTTAKSMGMLAILIAGGMVLTRFYMRYEVAQAFAHAVFYMFKSKTMILLSVNVFLLILGMFIEGTAIQILAIPLILPICVELGMNLVHVGAMLILNIGIGVITPPFAVAIFFGAKLCNVSSTDLIPIILKYLFFVAVPVLLITTFIPAVSCWLPTFLLGESIVGAY